MSELRITSTSGSLQDAERRAVRAKEGRGSDWTLFNKDYTVVLRANRLASVRWNQLHHRVKHADVVRVVFRFPFFVMVFNPFCIFLTYDPRRFSLARKPTCPSPRSRQEQLPLACCTWSVNRMEETCTLL